LPQNLRLARSPAEARAGFAARASLSPEADGVELAGTLGVLSIRFHGRGGQGVVTAAELLSAAAFREGRHAQAFPSFGSERTGAPVAAFCRIDDAPIRLREPILEPDVVVVLDATLLHSVDVFQGLAPDGKVLVSSAHTPDELGLAELGPRVLTVPGAEIARRVVGRPVTNTVLLGALSTMTGVVGMPAVLAAIRERFPGAVGERNAAAAAEAGELATREVRC
jgi:pyruvate ferredoxin oxidoreductase gamma subunit